MAVYSIKELESLSGIKAHTIRIWEKRYNLIEPHRTTTNIRYYTDNELKKILNVSVLNRHGIKISNIAKLSDKELKDEIMRVSSSNPSTENTIDSMIISMIDMDELKFISTLNKAIAKQGFTNAYINIVYPFLDKIGVLWMAGDINPAQEHFVLNLVRQKLIAAVDSFSHVYNPNAQKFLLFLPEGEWHEIGLLLALYLLKEAGHNVVYLGQSVPYSDVIATGSSRNFDHILVSSTVPQPEFDFITYLKDLGGAFPDKKIIYFAAYMSKDPDYFGKNYYQIKSAKDFQEYLNKLEA
ncbi:MAG TPA: MerR family transcriptional regulator [Bacteroidales bacterium]|nr:MerR family transcriptional regulator [Bacteroidales bacterium]